MKEISLRGITDVKNYNNHHAGQNLQLVFSQVSLTPLGCCDF
ncbi:MAG: hypothetical protein UC300_07780 [Prevotella sp.]|nr:MULTISPECIES: hypothetical protein [unclassified Prevotella]MEE0620857.1 hypothetical protein [Prevotella sp.]